MLSASILLRRVAVPVLEALVVPRSAPLLGYLLVGAEPRTGGRVGSLVSGEQVFPLLCR